MKPGDAEYTALVEQKRAEIRGNISSIKMTEAETQAEIAAIVPNYVGPNIMRGMAEVQPKRRGRPIGSKNKSK